MKKHRKYSYKDVDMLIAARTLCDNFENHKPDIVAVRPLWADPFIANFRNRINQAMTNYLGQDSSADLRTASQDVREKQATAMRDLSLFKIQLEVDFADEPERLAWIMTHLGFTGHWEDTRKKDQEGLIELLSMFYNNMDTALQTEIVNKGMDSGLIIDIMSYYMPLRDANVLQEALKNSTRELTDEAMDEFNGIFSLCMAIAKIGASVFRSNEVVKREFHFSRLVRSLNRPHRRTSESETPEETPGPGSGEGPTGE